MKKAAVYAIAAIAKQPVPPEVMAAYDVCNLEFGREYILPKPFDPRLLLEVSPAVALAAIESGVARKLITDWDKYRDYLKRLVDYDGKHNERLKAIARHEIRCRRKRNPTVSRKSE